jgi:hypothetical protein
MSARSFGHLGWLGLSGFLGFVPGWSDLKMLFVLCLLAMLYTLPDRSQKSAGS